MAKEPTFPGNSFELYQKVIATHDDFDIKGKNNPYTSHNGHMFTFLDKEGKMSIRFSPEDLCTFMEKHDAKPSIQYGSTMHGYAVVPDRLFEDTVTLGRYLVRSFDYIRTLKPKESKKKK